MWFMEIVQVWKIHCETINMYSHDDRVLHLVDATSKNQRSKTNASTVTANKYDLPMTEEFIYHKSNVTNNGGTDSDIKNSLSMARTPST